MNKSERVTMRYVIFTLVVFSLMLAAFALLMSCTITPKTPHATVPSFDGTNQNSGFLGWMADGQGVITVDAVARFNGLAARFGGYYDPPQGTNFGTTLATNNFIITQQALARFGQMTRWRNEGKPEKRP